MPKKQKDFDPKHLFYTTKEQESLSGYHSILFKHRFGLFNLFQKAFPDSKDDPEPIQKQMLKDFINQIGYDLHYHYTLLGYIIHIYYIYWSLSRVLYCFGEWSLYCDARPWTLVDASGWIQCLFYIGTFMPSSTIQQFTYYYIFYCINGALIFTFFMIDSDYKWILSGGKEYSTWNAVYTPILYYIVFVLMFSTRMALSCWVMSEFRRYELSDTRISGHSQYIHSLNQWTWITVYFLLHFTSFLLYWAYRYYKDIHQVTDLISWPGKFTMLLFAAMMGMISSAWVSFMTFQHRFIVWDEYWKSGLVLFEFQGEISFGVIY
jgi:hypothetical protein